MEFQGCPKIRRWSMMWLMEGGWLVAKFVADVLGCHCAVLEGLKLDWEAG